MQNLTTQSLRSPRGLWAKSVPNYTPSPCPPPPPCYDGIWKLLNQHGLWAIYSAYVPHSTPNPRLRGRESQLRVLQARSLDRDIWSVLKLQPWLCRDCQIKVVSRRDFIETVRLMCSRVNIWVRLLDLGGIALRLERDCEITVVSHQDLSKTARLRWYREKTLLRL